MEEENKKKIIGWFHTLNFIVSCGVGYALFAIQEYLVAYFVLELSLFIYFIVEKRKKDAIILVLSTLVALIIGFSICAYQISGFKT